MKANELRIGNWVNYPIHDEIAEVKDYIDTSMIDAEDIMFIEKNDDNDYDPIPITEEWLLKFGFEKKGHRTYFSYIDSSYGIVYQKGLSNICSIAIEKNDVVIYKYLKHIEYVHQLQNLYFALTGEELTIKE